MDQRILSGVLDLGNVPSTASLLDGRIEHVRWIETQHHRKGYHLTQRLFDEARPAGERTYIHAFHGIETAWKTTRLCLVLCRVRMAQHRLHRIT